MLHAADASNRWHARVWAPACRSVELVTEPDQTTAQLVAEGNGYHSGFVDGMTTGTLYRFRLDGKRDAVYPDPASRFQPDGPHGPSMSVDPSRYEWGDHDWAGVRIEGQVIYELHVGTFTKGGTLRTAIDRLPDLVDTGITVIEVLPLADFVGRFGWGYDGVNFFAPSRLYGTPDDLRAFVDAAHRLELGVILDVVYNHFGPDGNFLLPFAPQYRSAKRTEWGDGPNFDGADSAPVREYFLTNARYWIDEFHFDGLRLDATQQIFDTSTPHIVAEVGEAVRAAAPGRATIVIAENEPQDARLVRARAVGGHGLDAVWNDDFHHAARVAATGRNEAYFSGYRGVAQEFVSAAKYGFLYQGQWYTWQHQRRGTPSFDVPPARLVTFIENHDQVANSCAGRRLHQETSPGRYRALTALLLLLPQTPLLFQGQEFAASSPFLYFADHRAELATAIRDGRTRFIRQFESIATPEGGAGLADPTEPWTFLRSKLDWSERRRNARAVALHRDLLRIRREDAVIRAQRPRSIDGTVLSEHAFALRFFGAAGDDRLLVVNLGERRQIDPVAEPLMAPPPGCVWHTMFSTEAPAYGGWGTPPLEVADGGWRLPPESAVLLKPGNGTTASR